MASLKYRPELDGLRAVAIVPVILFHMNFSWIPGGFLGVDVFFVISGFLITSIIVKDFEQGTFSLPRFWSRRVRRILPALLTMILITSLVSAVFCFRPDTTNYGLQGSAAALSLANVALWVQVKDYWSATAQMTPFLHTWSLSVEEQYYLIYPLILIPLLQRGKRRTVLVLGLLWIISFLLSVLVPRLLIFGRHQESMISATFYLLPTRAWELATGCILAVLTGNQKPVMGRIVSELLACLGLAIVVASFILVGEESNFAGSVAMPVLGSALVIAMANNTHSFVGTLLSCRPLVLTGTLSYSLYLWHWPVIVLGRILGLDENLPIDQLFTVVLMLFMALASYQYVETPVRYQIKESAALRVCLTLLIATLAVSAYLNFRSTGYVDNMFKVEYKGRGYDVKPETTSNPKLTLNSFETGGILKLYGTSTPEIIVLGDSHAAMWSSLIDQFAKQQGVSVSFYAAGGTNPFLTLPLTRSTRMTNRFTPDQLLIYDQKRLEFLENWRPKAVVLVARWERYTVAQAKDLIEACGRVGSKVLLIEQPPMLFFGDRKTAQYLAYLHLWPKENQRQSIRALNWKDYDRGRAVVRDLCQRYPFCRLIPIADLFEAPGHQVWVLNGNKLLYLDDDHLSQAGAEEAGDRIRTALQSAMTEE